MGFDQTTTTIARFASSVTSLDVGEGTRAAVVEHHLDAVGCALGGLSSLPAILCRRVASEAPFEQGCSVFGLPSRVFPALAVFANVTMVRQLDFNDHYAAPYPRGHPSDMLPAVVAVAEQAHRSGSDIVRGAFVAYEVFAALSATYPFRENAWDHNGTFAAVGAAAGAGAILGLSFDAMANAISLALVPNMSLECTRNGELSNWKGSASAYSCMNGNFAATMAREGLTGPSAPFEGIGGLNRHVPPAKTLEIGDVPSAVERATIKQFPAAGPIQSIVGALLGIRGDLDLDDIDRILIETYAEGWRTNGGGAGNHDHDDKWRPTNPETADHSTAFVLAVALVDGQVTPASYRTERLSDPKVLAVIDKIAIEPREDLTAVYPAEKRSRIRIDRRSGTPINLSSIDPFGTPSNPMSDAQLSAKFHSMADNAIGEVRATDLESILWQLADLDDLDTLTRLYRAVVT